ncbi:hypothetical protein TOPH_00909, partial [Tolypocladium ophioglossoides CBS 100239]
LSLKLLLAHRVGSNLLVVALQGSQVLTGLRELAFLHALTDIPVHERTLGVHQVEFHRQRAPGLGNCGGVGQHAATSRLHSTVVLGEIAVGHVLRGLVADTKLEASRAPVNELNSALRLEGSNGGVGIVGHDVTAVEQAGGHVLAVAGIALDHLVVGLEAGHGHLLDGVGLVGSLGGGDDGCIRDQREVDSGVRHQVGLELVQINVEGAIKSERSGDGGND